MTIIEPKVELISEENPFKKIEMAGRTCYKSEANITDESALKFYKRLADNKHTAMLEHVTFVFEVFRPDLYKQCESKKYLNCTCVYFINGTIRMLVSGNLRALNEDYIAELLGVLYKNNPALVYGIDTPLYTETWDSVDELTMRNICGCKLVKLSDYNNLTEAEIETHTYTTMRFTCDRGVSHELVRHRPFSFAQESTRYVNYSKEQNGNGDIKFIKPADYDSWDLESQSHFSLALMNTESKYNGMIKCGRTPQEARAVLPNAVKTEIIVTGNGIEWNHFFDLRHFGTTGKPHPDMQVVADMAYEIYKNL